MWPSFKVGLATSKYPFTGLPTYLDFSRQPRLAITKIKYIFIPIEKDLIIHRKSWTALLSDTNNAFS